MKHLLKIFMWLRAWMAVRYVVACKDGSMVRGCVQGWQYGMWLRARMAMQYVIVCKDGSMVRGCTQGWQYGTWLQGWQCGMWLRARMAVRYVVACKDGSTVRGCVQGWQYGTVRLKFKNHAPYFKNLLYRYNVKSLRRRILQTGYPLALTQDLKKRSLTEKVRPVMSVLPSHAGNRKKR